MRRLFCAIAFLTRLPVPRGMTFDGADVARATLLFPAVGALVGALTASCAMGLGGRVPPLLASVLAVVFGVMLTGALHVDGLADMADGFGGGRTREDVLRIMRDHQIGAYGATAIALLLAVKIAALVPLVARGDALIPLTLGAALSRWASVVLGRLLPYARESGTAAFAEQVGALEIAGATIIAGGLAIGLGGMRGLVFFAAVAAASGLMALECKRRIGGVTGDTLGATVEICEALVWTLAAGLV